MNSNSEFDSDKLLKPFQDPKYQDVGNGQQSINASQAQFYEFK